MLKNKEFSLKIAELNSIDIAIFAADGKKIALKATVDTGATNTYIPTELAETLGLMNKRNTLGFNRTLTIDGPENNPIISLTLKITGTDGKISTFQHWEVLVADDIPVLIGIDILKYFTVTFERGNLVRLVFRDMNQLKSLI
jgi:predicted aspartyl protease